MQRAALLRRRAGSLPLRLGGGRAIVPPPPRFAATHIMCRCRTAPSLALPPPRRPPSSGRGGMIVRSFGAYASTGPRNNILTSTSSLENSLAADSAAAHAHEGHADDPSDAPHPGRTLTGRQRALLEHTASILPPLEECPPGTLSHPQLIQISNCIDAWISSGEHRYLGAEQAELLVKRLIIERGGGRSLLNDEEKGRIWTFDKDNDGHEEGKEAIVLRKNPEVSWDMYHIHQLVQYLDALYAGEEFVDRILGLLDAFEEEYATTDEYRSGDDGEIQYKDLIAALCDRHTPHSAAAAEWVLHRFESKLADVPHYHSNPPGVETYNSIVTAWKRSGSRGAAYPQNVAPPYRHHPNPSSNLLSEMLDIYRSNPRANARIRPDFITFNTTISNLSREQIDNGWRGDEYHRTAGRRCHEHLMSMLEIHHEAGAACAPDLITFSTVINTLGRGKDRGDEWRAREVLEAMLRLSGVIDGDDEDGDAAAEEYPFDVVPRNMHFNVVLSLMSGKERVDDTTLGLAKWYVGLMERLGRKEREGHKQCEGLPHTYDGRTDDEYDEDMHDNPPPMETEDEDRRIRMAHRSSGPDVITYNTLLKIAARAGRPAKAEDILNDMIEHASPGASEVRPDTDSFNTVLWAWSKSRSSHGKARTEKILHTMQKMADDGDERVQPDRVSFTTLLNAISSSEAPLEAEEIIKRMEGKDNPAMRPDTVAYTSLIRCWIDSGDPRMAHRAEEIIDHAHRRYDEGHSECQPDTMLYNVAMDALAKSGERDSAERAEALLNRMLDRYYAGDSNLAPITQSFSTAIQAWARSNHPQAAMKAERLLETMHDLEKTGLSVAPNTVAYSTCILAWRKAGGAEAGQHADALLRKMEQSEEKGLQSLKPNAMTYTNAMETWIGSRQPNSLAKVEGILKRMKERAFRGDLESAPTTTTYNVVMKAIQHSAHPTKHKKAEQLLNRMKELLKNGDSRVKPDTITYNTFFSACAMTEGNAETKMQAFSSVLSALIELQEHTSLRPDLYTWPAVWKATRNLLDVRQDLTWINRIFDLTIKSGFVNEYLFNNMRSNLPPQYLQKKLNTTKDIRQISVHDLPPEWTCNVRLGRDKRGDGGERGSNGQRKRRHRRKKAA